MAKLFLTFVGFFTANIMLQSYENWEINFGIVLMAASGAMAGAFILDFFKKRA